MLSGYKLKIGAKNLEDKKILTSIEEIKAYNDPYRIKILLTLIKMERPATGKEISDAMHEIPSKVHYHIKKMENAGILKLVNTKEINGIVAKYYEPAAKYFEIKNKYLDDSSKEIMINETCKMVSHIFEMAKDEFIENAHKTDNENKESKNTNEEARIYHEEVYLSDDEIEKFNNYILEITKEHTKRKEGTKKYSLFCSIIQNHNKE